MRGNIGGVFAKTLGIGSLLLSSACSEPEREKGWTEERRALGSETEVSALLGFALTDALPARDAYSATLDWGAAPEHVEFSPSQTSTRVSWSFAMPPRDFELWRIDEVDVQCDSGVSTNTRTCDDYLETVLTLRIQSEDGALWEELPVTFQALSPEQRFWKNTDLGVDGFQGTFRIENGPEALDVRIAALGSVSAEGADGELVGNVLLEREQGEHSGKTSGMVFYVARWAAGQRAAAP
jgi:hypothetical protein